MICDHGNNIKTLKLSYQVSNQSLIHVPSTGVTQLTLTLKTTTAQVVETSISVKNRPIQDYTHPDDHIPHTLAWDQAPHWGIKEKKIGERIDPSGSLGRERVAEPPLPVSPPQTTARLSSLADSFPISPRFCRFPPIAEPGPRLSYLWLFTFKYMTLCCRRNCPGKENRYDEVRQKYEQDRRTVILPLGASKHNDITLITAKSPDLFYLQVAEKIRCWAPMYNMT